MTQTKDNPFIHRWKQEDPKWVKQRKEQWSCMRINFGSTSAKGLKDLKDFFLFGAIRRDSRIYHPIGSLEIWQFQFTPCDTPREVIEVFESLAPSLYYKALNAVAFGFRCALNNSFGYLGGREELFAKALFSGEYREESVHVPSGREWGDYKKHITAEEFIPRFVFEAYRFLTETHSSPYNPVQYILEHYLSCIRHLEIKGQPIPHEARLQNLLSGVFNFVEPRAPWGEVSNVARFARRFAERLQQPDIPKSLRVAIEALGPNRLCEYSRTNAPKDVPSSLTSEWQAPEVRVLHNVAPDVALHVVLTSAQRTGLLPEAFRVLTPDMVNTASVLSDGFIEKSLGFNPGAVVPAYRVTVWFEPSIRISNHREARFGVDLLMLHGVPSTQNPPGVPSLIYHPRLSEHYRDGCVTEQLLLLEQQLRRDVLARCGEYLLHYQGEVDIGDVLPEVFQKNPEVRLGYHLVRDYKSGWVELNIDGPPVESWHGAPLPPLDLDARIELPSAKAIRTPPIARHRRGGGDVPDNVESWSVLAYFADPAHRARLMRLLPEETRPSLADELPPADASVFEQLEDMDYPTQMILLEEHLLFIDWEELGISLKELDQKLSACGGEIQKAQRFILADYDDVEELNGTYYKRKGDTFVKVNAKKKKLKMPDDFPEDGPLPQQLLALLQDF